MKTKMALVCMLAAAQFSSTVPIKDFFRVAATVLASRMGSDSGQYPAVAQESELMRMVDFNSSNQCRALTVKPVVTDEAYCYSLATGYAKGIFDALSPEQQSLERELMSILFFSSDDDFNSDDDGFERWPQFVVRYEGCLMDLLRDRLDKKIRN